MFTLDDILMLLDNLEQTDAAAYLAQALLGDEE